jgi:hypothetical protein
MKVHFSGTRGLIAAPGPSTVRCGGNTPCIEVVSGDVLIVLGRGSPCAEEQLALRRPLVARNGEAPGFVPAAARRPLRSNQPLGARWSRGTAKHPASCRPRLAVR